MKQSVFLMKHIQSKSSASWWFFSLPASILLSGCVHPDIQMMHAVEKGDSVTAKKAVQRGADRGLALVGAAKYKQHDLARTLLELGADPNRGTPSFVIDGTLETRPGGDYHYRAKRAPGVTALSWAVQNNDTEMANILLKGGASPGLEYYEADAHGAYPVPDLPGSADFFVDALDTYKFGSGPITFFPGTSKVTVQRIDDSHVDVIATVAPVPEKKATTALIKANRPDRSQIKQLLENASTGK